MTLLPHLNVGDKFNASDFEITVKTVKGSYGKYSGTGFIEIKFFGNPRINVSFNNITVSAASQMIAGYVNVDGYGFSILNEPLASDINTIINKITNELEELSDILEEVEDLLKSIEDLLAKTEELANEQNRQCIEEKKAFLEEILADLKSEPPSGLYDQQSVIDATAELEACLTEYNKDVKEIMDKLLQLLNISLINAKQLCANGEFEVNMADNSVQENFTNSYTNIVENIFGNVINNDYNPFPTNVTIESVEIQSNEEFNEFKPEDLPYGEEIVHYWNVEQNNALCYVMTLLGPNGLEGETLNTEGLKVIGAVLRAGIDISNDLKDKLTSSDTAQKIYDDNKEYLINALGKACTKIYYK
ncbi:MAG: hypothetical protein R2771_02410 [Saprospiraceae bacterium]